MARSHKHRIPAAFGGIMDTKTGRKRYVWGSIWDWATDNATELLKMAGSGIKGLYLFAVSITFVSHSHAIIFNSLFYDYI